MAVRAMSSEDFRAQLYHSLHGRGVLDSLKSQLRNRLVAELKKSLDGVEVISTSSQTTRKSLRTQVADSIVAGYLKCAGYEYSLSIFLPEAGTSIDNLCSEEDLFKYLRISSASTLYNNLQPHPQKPGNFLERLLEALIECQDSSINQPPTTPTVTPLKEAPKTPARKSVVDRLEELDVSYARKAQEESVKCRHSMEDRLLGFQHDLEARYKQHLDAELDLYRSKELARARQEERDRCRGELAKERADLHQAHQVKLETIRKSEQDMMEKYRRKEQELEAGIYAQRQTLLGELNALRVKEAGLKRDLELDKRTVALEKEQMKALTEQLESNMKVMKTRFEKTAEERVQQVKVEAELQLQSKRAELAKWETQLKSDAESAESLKLENKKLMAELSEQQKLLQAQAKENANRSIGALQQSEEILGQFSDYRKRVAELKQQLSSSENRCSELKAIQKHHQSTVKQLQAKLSKPSPELMSLQAEMEHLRKVHHKELLVLQYDNKQLRRQLTEQTEQSIVSQARLDEQLVQLRSTQREVQDLHFMLEHSQAQKAPNNKARLGKSVQSSSKKASLPTKLPSAHHHHTQPSKSTPPPAPYHTTPLYREDLTSTHGFHRPNEKNVNFFDSSAMFLADSRAAIERMEKEAQQLERSYFDFNHRMLSSSHEGASRLPSLLPGASPSLDVSFPSHFEPSAATPVQTSPTFRHSLLRHHTDEMSHPGSEFTSPDSSPVPVPDPAVPHSILHPPSSVTRNFSPMASPAYNLPSSIPPPTSYPPSSIQLPISNLPSSIPPPTSYPPSSIQLPISNLPSSMPPQTSSSPTSTSVPPLTPNPASSIPDPVTSMPPQVPYSLPPPKTEAAPSVPFTPSSLTHMPKHTPVATGSHSTKFPPSVAGANDLAAAAAAASVGNSLPGLSFTLHTPAPAPARTALSTELSSAGNTTVFPKSTMSLDSWWKAASEPSSAENASFSNAKVTAESQVKSGDDQTAIAPAVSSPDLTASAPTAISSSPAVTRLTGATNTPIASVSHSTSEERSGSLLRNGPVITGPGDSDGITPRNGKPDNTEEERLPEPKEATADHHHQPPTAATAGTLSPQVEVKKDESDEDSIDPVMLKYMQLVTEKRQQKNTQHLQAQGGDRSESPKEFDVPALSQDVNSADGFSDHDAFEDW